MATKRINFESTVWRKGYFNVGVEDITNTGGVSDHVERIGEFIHELAHVYLLDVWQRNVKILMEKIPEFINFNEGKYFLNGNLFDYLQERYLR